MYKFLCLICIIMMRSVTAFTNFYVEDDWKWDAIDEQLAPLKSLGLSQDMILNYEIDNGYMYLYVIKDDVLTVTSCSKREIIRVRSDIIAGAINDILSEASLPDMAFLVHVGDRYLRKGEGELPVFVVTKRACDKRLLLLPCWENLVDFKPGSRWPCARLASNQIPWNMKRNMAFWRGSPTGFESTSGEFISITSSRWRELPRPQLVLRAMESSFYVNAKFTVHWDGLDPDFEQTLGPPRSYCPLDKHFHFKYLIDIDGNSYGTRLGWIMASNCMPIRVEGVWSLWYYAALEPYKHYLPVKGDSTDLLEQVSWAKTHDTEAKQIALNSTAFADVYFNREAVYSYIYHLLLQYSQLFND